MRFILPIWSYRDDAPTPPIRHINFAENATDLSKRLRAAWGNLRVEKLAQVLAWAEAILAAAVLLLGFALLVLGFWAAFSTLAVVCGFAAFIKGISHPGTGLDLQSAGSRPVPTVSPSPGGADSEGRQASW